MDKYKKLVELIEMGAYESAYNLIEQLSKSVITHKNEFFYSLYVLIQNGYGNKVTKLFDNIFYDSKNNDLRKLLYRAIHEVDMYDSLDDEMKNRVNEYIELIREAFTLEEYFNVYDLCEMGFYLTSLPIFKYYEGKMFYKMEEYGLCIKTLDEYLKTGASKTSKAYLYLSCSYYHLNKLKDSRKYASKVYGTNCINGDSFDYVAPQDRGDDSKKNTTQFTLRMKLEDFYE